MSDVPFDCAPCKGRGCENDSRPYSITCSECDLSDVPNLGLERK